MKEEKPDKIMRKLGLLEKFNQADSNKSVAYEIVRFGPRMQTDTSNFRKEELTREEGMADD